MSAPYYEDELVTLYHGDSRDVLPSLERGDGNVADLVLTDPPYGARIAAWDFQWPSWIEEVAVAPVVALLPGVMNLGKLTNNFGGLPYRWTLNAILPTSARSPFGFCYWNPCVVYAETSVSLMRGAPDVRTFPIHRDQETWHPSPKPLSVMRWLVEMLPGATVLDPFAGSGTTLRAAKDEGRKAIGVESDERYCEGIAKRLGQDTLFGAAS